MQPPLSCYWYLQTFTLFPERWCVWKRKISANKLHIDHRKDDAFSFSLSFFFNQGWMRWWRFVYSNCTVWFRSFHQNQRSIIVERANQLFAFIEWWPWLIYDEQWYHHEFSRIRCCPCFFSIKDSSARVILSISSDLMLSLSVSFFSSFSSLSVSYLLTSEIRFTDSRFHCSSRLLGQTTLNEALGQVTVHRILITKTIDLKLIEFFAKLASIQLTTL